MLVRRTLGLPLLAALAACATAEQPTATSSALEAGWDGERVCELLHETADQRMLRCTFPPGVGHERHYHPPHLGYALSGGTMRITDAGGTREVRLDTGSSYKSDGTAWHEVLNVGTSPVIYLIIEDRRGLR